MARVFCKETLEEFDVDYPMELFRLFSDEFKPVCEVGPVCVVCDTTAKSEQLKAFVARNVDCQRVKDAAAKVLGQEVVDEVCEEAIDTPVLEKDAYIIARLCSKMQMRSSTAVSKGTVENFKKLAAEEFLEDVNEAYLDADIDRIIKALPHGDNRDALAAILRRVAIHGFVRIIRAAMGNIVINDTHYQERFDSMNEGEEKAFQCIRAEITARARGLLEESFDEANKGE